MATVLGLDLTRKNISPDPGCLGPHVYALVNAGSAYDINQPRSLRENVSRSEKLDAPTKERILRAKNTSDNGFESLGFFAAGVLAAHDAGVSVGELNALSLGYLAARALYFGVYVHLQPLDRRFAGLRTGLWQLGVGIIATLWIRAGIFTLRR